MSWLDEGGIHASDHSSPASIAFDVAGHEIEWRIARIDLTSVTDKASMLDAIADGLDAPEHMGRNWDAVVDVLGDRRTPLVVVLDGTTRVGADGARDLAILRDIIDEQTRLETPLTRAIELPGDRTSGESASG